jgi:hypothetical protein
VANDSFAASDVSLCQMTSYDMATHHHGDHSGTALHILHSMALGSTFTVHTQMQGPLMISAKF